MKLKVKPSSRIKRRFMLIEGGKREEIEKIILDYLGSLGRAKASPLFLEGGKKEGRMILAVSRKEIENVRAAFEISGKNIKVLRVSGTLKRLSLEKKPWKEK
jgi:RNase P/RNase MRP subunit POP5